MAYDLSQLKTLTQPELINFFSKLIEELQALENPRAVLNFLETKGMGKDDKTEEGASLLHYAALAGSQPAITMLLNIGFLNEKTKSGAVLGHYAAIGGHIELIEELNQKKFFDYNAKDNHGAGVILYAARGGQLQTLHSLITLGFDKNEKNDSGATAIHYAVIGAPIVNIKSLIALGYSPHDKDNNGNTALHYAAFFGREELITLLIENYGLNPYSQNDDGKTIFDLLD